MDDSEGIVPAPLTEVNAAAGAARSELLASVAQLPKRTNVAAAVETAAPDASILRFSPPVGGAVGPNGLSESLNGLFGPHAANPVLLFTALAAVSAAAAGSFRCEGMDGSLVLRVALVNEAARWPAGASAVLHAAHECEASECRDWQEAQSMRKAA